MLSALMLTPEQHKSLRRQARRAIGRVSERIHFVLLFARGYSLEQIAQLYQIDQRTVSTWIERFQQEGLLGLDDRPEPGGHD
jgi:transposase